MIFNNICGANGNRTSVRRKRLIINDKRISFSLHSEQILFSTTAKKSSIMNIKLYQGAKGNYCLYVTNSSKDRFRVQTNFSKFTEAESKRVKLEKLLPLSKAQVQAFLSDQPIDEAGKNRFSTTIKRFVSKTELESQWTYSTVMHFRGLERRIVRQFGDLFIEDMCNEDWLYSYISWRGRNTINTTLQKEVKSLRQFFKWVEYNGLCDCKSILKVRPKFKKASRPNVVFLNRDELRQLAEADIDTPYLIKARDLFLFSCMTGLRYSDTQRIGRSNVTGRTLRFTTKKTDDTLTIPLNDISYSILEKYDYKLPKMENQVINRFLKELCRRAAIDTPTTVIHYKGSSRIEVTGPKWQFVSTHSARKSFVSNSLMLGVPVPTVMSCTGHKSYQVMQAYVAVADEAKQAAVQSLQNFFS